MNQPVQLGVATRRGIAPRARALGAEEIFDAAAEPRHVPRQAMPLNRVRNPGFEPLPERDHARECVVRQHLAERGTHRGE